MGSDNHSDSSRPTIATLSNVITVIRILLVPVFVAAVLAPWPAWLGLNVAFSNNWKSVIATGIFVVISATDWLDGYLARSRNEVTDFGKFMDPLADKILVTAALICLVELGDLPTWVVLIILAREFIVSGVRMMAASKGVVIAASMIGKFKTVFQMIAIVLFTVKRSYMFGTLGEAFGDFLWLLSWATMIIALALTIASMMDYLVKSRDIIGLGKPDGVLATVGNNDCACSSLDERMLESARDVIAAALESNTTLSTAESLTGGLIGAALTSVPGSSAVYKGGIVSYTNEVKESHLGVNPDDLVRVGAVSQVVAEQMAAGARERIKSTLAVSVTGLAGPDGDEYGNPVGTVWIGIASDSGCQAYCERFDGDRSEVRFQTAIKALQLMESHINADA